GDVLVITGGRQAGLAPTQPIAGVGGPGTFISNGGTLKLDTVLNEGGPTATRSDTLVVDGTSLGAGGATTMAIRNVGGTGALTVGNGILGGQVLHPTRWPRGAFALPAGQERGAGAFDYGLFHGGPSGNNTSDWFLRSTFIVGPIPPEPPILPP